MSTAKIFGKKEFEKLAEPFDTKTICVKAHAFNSGRTKVMLVPYLQHTDVYARFETVDPSWSSKVTHITFDRIADDKFLTAFVVVELTILGVTRTNTGQGEDLKGATSDGIKRAAMLFGVGRYLYDAVPVWAMYNEAQDKYRVWTYADYEEARRSDQPSLPVAEDSRGSPEPSAPAVRSKEEVEGAVFAMGRELGWDEQQLFDEAEQHSGKDLDRISTADLERFLEHLVSLRSRPAKRGFGR
jgi:hypothetical protein